MLGYPNQTDFSVCSIDDVSNKGGFCLGNFFRGITSTVFESLKGQKVQVIEFFLNSSVFFFVQKMD